MRNHIEVPNILSCIDESRVVRRIIVWLDLTLGLSFIILFVQFSVPELFSSSIRLPN